MRVSWQWVCGFNVSGHDECANLKVICVRIGDGTWEVAESAVAVAARQRPTRSSLNGRPAIRALVSELAKSEHSVKCRVTIARGQVQEPTPVALLVSQDALNDPLRHRSRFSHEPIVMSRMKC